MLLEASALGVPIAAMDTGGTRDIVVHDETGLLSTTPEALASRRGPARPMTPSCRARLGSGSHERRARERFAAPVVVDDGAGSTRS